MKLKVLHLYATYNTSRMDIRGNKGKKIIHKKPTLVTNDLLHSERYLHSLPNNHHQNSTQNLSVCVFLVTLAITEIIHPWWWMNDYRAMVD